jgi:hypothetical protein
MSREKERRRYPRFSCDGPASVRVLMVESRYHGRILDLSTNGAYLHFDGPFRISFGQRLEIEFETNGLQFRVMACVRMVEPYCGVGVGVEFTDISSRGRRQLLELIKELEDMQREQRQSLAEAQQRADSLVANATTPASPGPRQAPGAGS